MRYAENMGVHAVYEAAQEARRRWEQARNDLAVLRSERRNIDQRLTDREFEILSDERGRNPASSVAALERQVKSLVNSDAVHRAMRHEHDRLSSDIEATETVVHMAKIDIEIATARMQELGGYLSYLAELKRAETAAATTGNPPATWPGVSTV